MNSRKLKSCGCSTSRAKERRGCPIRKAKRQEIHDRQGQCPDQQKQAAHAQRKPDSLLVFQFSEPRDQSNDDVREHGHLQQLDKPFANDFEWSRYLPQENTRRNAQT